jgi:hypothetical protein
MSSTSAPPHEPPGPAGGDGTATTEPQDAKADPTAEPAPRHRAARPRPELTAAELAALVLVTALAAVATASLALAQLGRHNGWTALGIGLAATVVIAGAGVAVDGRPRVRVDAVEIVLLVAVTAAGVFFFLPGFHYEWDDKDPGVYVAHAFAIARTGDVWIDDAVVAHGITPAVDQSGRLPGIWSDGGHPAQVSSQFFHLYSALLATADDIGGPRALFNVTPLLAVMSLALIVLAARRAAGTLVAAVTGAFVVTSMMQVWQAKYPSTEILAQTLLAGSLLAAVLAITRRSTTAALVAGLLTGIGFLTRPDGFLYVAIAIGIVALALAADRFDRRCWAVLAGLALTLPYALWNAYVERLVYTRSNSVPGKLVLSAALAAMLLAGLVARYPRRAIGRRWPRFDLAQPDRLPAKLRVGVGATVAALAIVALVALYFREEILGRDYRYLLFTGTVERSFQEQNLKWLSYFVTVPGLAVMAAGIVVLMVGRWRAALFTLVMPGLLLLYLYLWDAKVSMRMMWWVRRFVPAAVPAIALLMALAICWALTRRPLALKALGAVVCLSLLIVYAGDSLPLRHHDEMGGSGDLAAAVARFAGDRQAVFLFPPGHDIVGINRNAPGIVWFVEDQIAARLPSEPAMADVAPYRAAFPDKEIFVVNEGDELPGTLPADEFREAGQVVGDIRYWQESRNSRPSHATVHRLGATVWRLARPGEAARAG